MTATTLSAKNQIVIPREAREALHDKLLAVVRGNQVIVLQKFKKYHAAIRGLGAGTYPAGYFRRERRSWD
jgi:bifunctional DNA-binding transcriptional regulator/antitoxin component of YhaV-PrlF toxin-antitoxin module